MNKKCKSGFFLAAILASTFIPGVAEAAKGLDLNLDYSVNFYENRNSSLGSLSRNVARTVERLRSSPITVVAEAEKGFGLNLDRNVSFYKNSNFSLNRLTRNDARPVVWPLTSSAMGDAQNFWQSGDSWKFGNFWAPVSSRPSENFWLSEFFSIPSLESLIRSKAGAVAMSRTSSLISDGLGSWLSASSGSWSSVSSWGSWSFEFISHPWVAPNVVAVPEPETYAMLLSGLGLLGFMVRRRKNSGK